MSQLPTLISAVQLIPELSLGGDELSPTDFVIGCHGNPLMYGFYALSEGFHPLVGVLYPRLGMLCG